MKLKAQLHILSREAVNYGLATVVMEEAVNPVLTHLLFQLFAVEKVDSIIFLENAHTAQTGKEISRIQLKANIEKQLQKLGTIPANLA